MKSIVPYPTRLLSKQFHFKQDSHFVESLWLTMSLFTLFGVTSILVLFAKSYATASTIETSRIDEATYLLHSYCATAKGATLSKEFARCEDASVLVRNKKLSRMRVFEATWKNALNRDMLLYIKIFKDGLDSINLINLNFKLFNKFIILIQNLLYINRLA